jgi:N-acyl-D-aspartate/D-glutamate deacylase
MVYDLPANARRLVQRVDGYAMTICSGEIIREHGRDTGARPGKLVRGPQAALAV